MTDSTDPDDARVVFHREGVQLEMPARYCWADVLHAVKRQVDQHREEWLAEQVAKRARR